MYTIILIDNNKSMEDFNLQSKIDKLKKSEPKRKISRNMLKAFLVGGLICMLSEVIFNLYHMRFSSEEANDYTILTVIGLASVLTALGVYDRIGQFAGCGSIIPISGFANSMTASAMESKTEGIVVGIVNNVFKIAGSVIVVAVVCGVFSGLIRYLGGVIFG